MTGVCISVKVIIKYQVLIYLLAVHFSGCRLRSRGPLETLYRYQDNDQMKSQQNKSRVLKFFTFKTYGYNKGTYRAGHIRPSSGRLGSELDVLKCIILITDDTRLIRMSYVPNVRICILPWYATSISS